MLKKWFIIFILVFIATCVKTDIQENSDIKDDKGEYMFEIEKTEEEWRKELPPDVYYIMREKGTERPFSGEYYDHKEKGVYHCAACGNKLFGSEAKFESGTGWPSFYEPYDENSVVKRPDSASGMIRTEVLCARCGGHLGHVFDDGPPPTGKRYCINSLALDFEKK